MNLRFRAGRFLAALATLAALGAPARATSLFVPEPPLQPGTLDTGRPSSDTFAKGVLFRRLEWMLRHQASALRSCSARLPAPDALPVLGLARAIEKTLDRSRDGKEGALSLTDRILQSFSLIATVESMESRRTPPAPLILDRSYRLIGAAGPDEGAVLRESRDCSPEIRAAREEIHAAERRLFAPAVGALALAAPAEHRRFAALVDPHCSTPVGPNPQGYADSNPCFAGDGLVWGRIHGSRLTHESLVSAFERRVREVPDGSALDLWSLHVSRDRYLNDLSFDERMKFLGFLAFGMAASTANAGYVDGFGELAWREGMPDPAEALESYHAYKRLKSQFGRAWNGALARKIRILVNGEDWSGVDRHEAMAAFLACELATDEVTLATFLVPSLATSSMGIAYESKDLISHLREGASLRESAKNFRADTARFRRGYRRGIGFCRFERETREESP